MYWIAALGASLALLAPTAATAQAADAPPAAEAPVTTTRTLWLVQPLYPGQEAMIGRTEDAIARLFEEGDASAEVIGRSQLTSERPDTGVVEACLFGDGPCDDPVGALVRTYGFGQVILVRAGQDGSGFRFRVASFAPGGFDSATAENAGARLEEALLGALVKVAPLASQVRVTTDPPGATVFLDGEPVGTTPLVTQALPGSRTFRVELALHQPVEWKQKVPVRGRLQMEHALQEVPAMVIVRSEGATILVNGEQKGMGEAQVGLAPGSHLLRLERDGHHPWEERFTLAAGEEKRVEHDLEATGWHAFTRTLSREQEAIYDRSSYFSLSWDSFRFVDGTITASTLQGRSTRESEGIAPADASMWGVTAEYGTLGRHFGLLFIGGSFFQSGSDLDLLVPARGDDPAARFGAQVMGGSLRLLHPQLRLAVWRLVFDVQGGFVGRIAHVDQVSGTGFSQGFLLADLGVDLKVGGKIFVVDGLFLEGAWLRSFTITGSTDGTTGFRGGIGYAF